MGKFLNIEILKWKVRLSGVCFQVLPGSIQTSAYRYFKKNKKPFACDKYTWSQISCHANKISSLYFRSLSHQKLRIRENTMMQRFRCGATATVSEHKVPVISDSPVPPYRKTHITCYYSETIRAEHQTTAKGFNVSMLTCSQLHAN